MLFNSIEFLIFFPIVTLLYFLLPQKFRVYHLLIASCYFYMAFVPVYIFILFGTIIIDYIAGIWIERSQGKKRKMFLVMSLIANIGVLAVFKYYNFFNENISRVLHHFGLENHIPFLSILLPIGLSFHTFQAMSYTIEVYRGNQKAEKNFWYYSLYVMFYPQLVAGPIERPQNILHQLHEHHKPDYDNISNGLKLMAWGMFKKIVIADRLAVVVNNIYDSPLDHSGLSLIIATFFFCFQIFCDFSGYSDIALGSAQVMGIRLMKNFDRPYSSRSISEFWSRWHISLSSWFRDYLYIPLGGNRVSVPRWYINYLIVFAVSGLWHGASWNFVIWGMLHGVYLILTLIIKNTRARLFPNYTGGPVSNFLYKVLTFILVAVAWVFFRARTTDEAWYIISHFGTGLSFSGQYLKTSLYSLGVSTYELALCFGLIFFLELVHHLQHNLSITGYVNRFPAVKRWALYIVFMIAILLLAAGGKQQFIYFQF